MKSIFLVLLFSVAFANAAEQKNMGLDFLLDNIVNPMLDGIYNNTVGFLIGQLFNNIIGKRAVGNAEIVSQVANLFNSYKEKLAALIKKYSAMLQSVIGNIFNPQLDFSNLLADAEVEIRKETFSIVNALFQIFQTIFGDKFLELNGSARGVFGNLAAIFNNFATTITTSLESFSQNLVQTVQSVNILTAPGLSHLGENIVAGLQNVIEQLNQAISQIGQH